VTTEQSSTGPSTDDGTDRVVVGVDGSPMSRTALVWALRAAAGSRGRVEVLSAYPVDFYWTDPLLVDTRRIDDVRTDTENRARKFVEEVRRDPAVAATPAAAGVAVDVVVPAGAPSAAPSSDPSPCTASPTRRARSSWCTTPSRPLRLAWWSA
jgi:hypothetical protein